MLLQISSVKTGHVEGYITDIHDEPVIAANIGIISLNKGTSTDGEGFYKIKNIQAGTYTIEVSALGYKRFRKEIVIEPDKITYLNVRLEEQIEKLPQLVVTGTLRETKLKDTPVKVQVLTAQYLQKNPSSNLMDNISFINGLYEEVGCGVCSTNSVRINGMQGPYTAVLIDGMPIMGSLASVYGLNGINPAIIETIEITKGPNSTLYGSEAMGGVINIRTKNPDAANSVHLDIYGTTHQEANLDVSLTKNINKVRTLWSGSIYHFDHFLDGNNDGFSDLTKNNRYAFFTKWNFSSENNQNLNLAAKLYFEDRLGGTEFYSKKYRGSSEVYGESILTKRFELMSDYDFSISGEQLSLNTSYSYHDQNSWYGDYSYQASQSIIYSNLVWDKQFDIQNLLVAGTSFKYDRLEQIFGEQYVPYGSSDNRFVPGLFAQYERIFNNTLRGLAGLRLDYHNKHGYILSPRLNIKLDATDHTTIRFNTGTGFRVVNIFTEQHEVLSGSRVVEIQEELNPERSINGTLNINQIIDIGVSVLNIDFDLFYTRFSNQILPDYQTPGKIIYTNLKGYAATRGFALNAAHNFPSPLMYSIGFTVQDVFQSFEGVKHPVFHAPEWSSVFSLSYEFEQWNTSVDFTGRIVGKMYLPKYPGYSDRSEIFTEQNIKLTRTFGNGWSTYINVKNLFDYTQKNPIVAPDRPFSDDFATDRVFGPLQGRRILFGLRYDLDS